MLLRRSDALTLLWEWLDGDPRGPDRPASKSDEGPGCVAFLGAGDAGPLIGPGDGELDPDFDRARKISHYVDKFFDYSKAEFTAAEMLPGSMLDVEQSAGVRADGSAAACEGRVSAERRRLRDAGRNRRGDGNHPGAFQSLRLLLFYSIQYIKKPALLIGLSGDAFIGRLSAQRGRRDNDHSRQDQREANFLIVINFCLFI